MFHIFWCKGFFLYYYSIGKNDDLRGFYLIKVHISTLSHDSRSWVFLANHQICVKIIGLGSTEVVKEKFSTAFAQNPAHWDWMGCSSLACLKLLSQMHVIRFEVYFLPHLIEVYSLRWWTFWRRNPGEQQVASLLSCWCRSWRWRHWEVCSGCDGWGYWFRTKEPNQTATSQQKINSPPKP